MTSIPRAVLEYATSQVNALSADAQARVLKVLESISWTPENIADCRDLVLETLHSVLPGYTSMSAQAGADMYDAIREYSTGQALGAQAISGYVQDATDGAVRAFVQDIVDGKPIEQFNGRVLDRVDYDIRKAANVCAARNAERDPLKPRYARIPSGGETCTFCLMLASRGFVYTSEEAASHAHANCDCRVVPGFPGMEVEGYDPNELYEQWKNGEPKKHEGAEQPYPQIIGEHDRQSDLLRTNPKYSSGVEYRINCQRCVAAYEMRRRGYDVTAKSRPMVDGRPDRADKLPNRLDPEGWPHMFEDPELRPCSSTTGAKTKDKVEKQMASWGDGARAIVRVQWQKRYGGGGHVFIAEQVDGRTLFVDPQSNNADCSHYFKSVVKNQTFCMRVDDREITELIDKAVEAAK